MAEWFASKLLLYEKSQPLRNLIETQIQRISKKYMSFIDEVSDMNKIIRHVWPELQERKLDLNTDNPQLREINERMY